jgi:ArsR family transcriptional regulator, lead/cadmium/zinc/bismuth-responsive transcriptional repressor
MNNSCIRVLADVNQINACKEDIERVAPEIERVAKVLNLAGNEVRLKMLFLIYNEGEMCPCDLSDVLDMSVPAVSQHLRKLKDGGLVKDNKIGQTIFYRLIDENISILYPMLKNMKTINNLNKVENE